MTLDGINVVDASEGVAAGYCTRLLAGLGAAVVKAEMPGRGDSLRRAGPYVGGLPHVEKSIPHLHLNAAKRSVTLDATTSSGRWLMRSLADRADVLIARDAAMAQGFASGAIVVATITPFGASGDRASWRSTDLVAHAFGGYLAMTGDRDREPIKPYGDQSAYQAGLHAALGIVAAVIARERGGGPGRVDASAAEASAFLTGGAIARAHFFAREARESVRNGTRPVGFPPEYLYPSVVRPCGPDADGKPGWVYVHRHNRFPDLLAALMQEPRLADPDVLATPLGHADEIDGIVDGWLASRDKWVAVAEAQELRLPFTEVLDPAEVVADRHGHLTARGSLTTPEHSSAGATLEVGAPVAMPATPWRAGPAPRLGEHNAEVYCGELALSPRDLSQLAAAGAI